MEIINFDDLAGSKDQNPSIKDLASNFIRLNILSDKGAVDGVSLLSDDQKDLFEKVLNHLTDNFELQLKISDIENFEKAENYLRPSLKSNESSIMFYLYLLCRCSFESASDDVLKAWRDILAEFELETKSTDKDIRSTLRSYKKS